MPYVYRAPIVGLLLLNAKPNCRATMLPGLPKVVIMGPSASRAQETLLTMTGGTRLLEAEEAFCGDGLGKQSRKGYKERESIRWIWKQFRASSGKNRDINRGPVL